MGDGRRMLDWEAAAWRAGLIGAKHARREPTKNPACFAPRKRLILYDAAHGYARERVRKQADAWPGAAREAARRYDTCRGEHLASFLVKDGAVCPCPCTLLASMLAYSLQVRLSVPRQDTGSYQTMALTQVRASTGVASWSWITPADTLLLTSDSVAGQAVGTLGQARLKVTISGG